MCGVYGAAGQVNPTPLGYCCHSMKTGQTGIDVNDTESRLHEEVRFWLNLSSDLLEAADELQRKRALMALTDAIKRLLRYRRPPTH